MTDQERQQYINEAIFRRKMPAIICDMDGTLADIKHRSPWDQHLCEVDGLEQHVKDMVTEYGNAGFWIIIVSGRFKQHTQRTINWLQKHNVPFDYLFLREDKDQRPDEVIKREIYETYIEPYYHVVKVIDDRPKVIRMWKELGLDVVDVGDGHEF